MKKLLKLSLYSLALITLFSPAYSQAAVQNINTATVIKKILSTDDSLSSIRSTPAGKNIQSTQLVLKSSIGTSASAVTIRQSYDAKINATYLEIIYQNSQFKMIQKTVNGKIDRYVFITKSFAENTLATTGSGAYIPYADKWVLLDDTKITIESVLTDVIKGSIPFTIAQMDSSVLLTNTATKDKSGAITLDLSVATTTIVSIGTMKYIPLVQQDSFILTHKAVLGGVTFDSNINYTRSTQKGTAFVIPKIFSYASQTKINEEIELDAKGTVYSLEQSGLVVGTTLPAGFSLCPKNDFVDLSIYCVQNSDTLKSVISIFAWSSGSTKDDIGKIKNDTDARRIIPTWFTPGDTQRVYKNAYTKTINGSFFVLKEEQSYYNNKLNYFFTAYTIKDGKLFKIELGTKDLKDSSLATQRANLIFFIENSFQKNTTAQSTVVSTQPKNTDSLVMQSLNKIQKANITTVGIVQVNDTNPPYAVPVRSGFLFDNQIAYNKSVFIKQNSGGREIQIQINEGGKLGLSTDASYLKAANGAEFERTYKSYFPANQSTNFNVFRKNGYVFATFKTYDPKSFAGIYTYLIDMYITRDTLNSSDPYFTISFASNKPIDEQLVTEFVEGFTF